MAQLKQRGHVWYSDFRHNGKRIQRALSTDKRIALKMLGKLLGQRSADHHGHAPTETDWASFRDKYLKERATMARPTYTITKKAIERLEAFRPIVSIQQITPSLLADLLTDWKTAKHKIKGTKKLSSIGLYMRNRMIDLLKTMMRRAESWGLVEKQDWTSIKIDKEPKGRLLWYTADELKRLLTVCNGQWETLAMLGARAGLRRSEAYWLEWTDVDFERNRIHIAPKKEWTPKDYERRWIPMTADLRAYLHQIKPKGRYLVEEEGERPTLESVSVYFKRLVKKVYLRGNVHTLRHTFGAHLASAGVSLRIIQKLMGHSSVEMTEVYAHLSPESIEDSVTRLPPL